MIQRQNNKRAKSVEADSECFRCDRLFVLSFLLWIRCLYFRLHFLFVRCDCLFRNSRQQSIRKRNRVDIFTLPRNFHFKLCFVFFFAVRKLHEMKSIRPCVVMWLLLLVLHTFSCVVFCREPPIIEIPDQGEIMGFYMKMFRIHKIIAYLGIPYAQPPLKERRFQAPFIDNLPAWEGVRNATQVPFECWSDNVTQLKQHDELFLKLLGVDPSERANDGDRFNEDCLYLNVFMPEGKRMTSENKRHVQLRLPTMTNPSVKNPLCLNQCRLFINFAARIVRQVSVTEMTNEK